MVFLYRKGKPGHKEKRTDGKGLKGGVILWESPDNHLTGRKAGKERLGKVRSQKRKARGCPPRATRRSGREEYKKEGKKFPPKTSRDQKKNVRGEVHQYWLQPTTRRKQRGSPLISITGKEGKREKGKSLKPGQEKKVGNINTSGTESLETEKPGRVQEGTRSNHEEKKGL